MTSRTQRVADEGEKRMMRCFNWLLATQDYFGALVMQLPMKADPERKTIACDGENLYYNPKWAREASSDSMRLAMSHLVMACALKHHTRRNGRDYCRWQRASQAVTLPVLRDAGITRMEGGLDMSIEQAYRLMPEIQPMTQENNPDSDPSDSDEQQQQQQVMAAGGGGTSDDQQDQSDDQQGQSGASGAGGDQSDDQQQQQGNSSGSDQQNQDQSKNQSDQNQQGGAGDQPFDDPNGMGEILDSPAKDRKRPQDQSSQGDGDGDGDTDGNADQSGGGGSGNWHEKGPGEKASGLQEEEQRWDEMMHQAMQMAKARGRIPGRAKEILDTAHKTRIDWKTELRRFMQAHAPRDYTWAVPNKRHIAAGLYLPSQRTEAMERIVFAIDTSYSLNTEELNVLWGEVREATVAISPDRVNIIQCDTDVRSNIEYEMFQLPKKLDIIGRGGTAFEPVFEEVRRKSTRPPVCLIYCTDLECFEYGPKPPYPVLWAVVRSREVRRKRGYGVPDNLKPPFGEIIEVIR